MSRSNPNEGSRNPCTRWFEWSGGADGGFVTYYDKAQGENIRVPDKFTFLVLDELATVRGWHEASESGIYSNEVRDIKQEVLIVKSFKGGVLAEGVYSAIRDRIGNMGGHFTLNMYIGYKGADGALVLGALQLKGAALNAWVEFRKANSTAILQKAVCITGALDGKKGSVKFKTPTFGLVDVSKERNEEAIALDRSLQDYLKGYLARPKNEAAKPPQQETSGDDLRIPDQQADAEAERQNEKAVERAAQAVDNGTPFDDEIPF